MALVPTTYLMTVKFLDSRNRQRSRQYEIDATGADADAELLDARAKAALMMTRLASASEAELLGYTLSSIVLEDNVTIPAGNVDVTFRALVTAALDAPGIKTHTFDIPAPAAAIVPSGSQDVEESATELANFLAMFATGGLMCSDGEKLRDPLQILGSETVDR